MATHLMTTRMSGMSASAPKGTGAALTAGARHVTRRLLAWFSEQRRYHETLRELSRLDDRQLDDIGIARRDIPSIARQSAAAATRF